MKQATDWTKIALYAATGVVAVILGVMLSVTVFSSGPGSLGSAERQVPIGGPFELIDQTGAPRTEDLLLGEVSFVYFGFTHCPDFCPIELSNLSEAKKLLVEKGVTPQIVFISVDPDRDTPEVLDGYVSFFDPDIIGLTGSEEQVAAAAKAYRVFYQKQPPADDDPEDYAVDHTTLVYAMGKDGRFLMHFSAHTDPKIIAQKLSEALAAGGGGQS